MLLQVATPQQQLRKPDIDKCSTSAVYIFQGLARFAMLSPGAAMQTFHKRDLHKPFISLSGYTALKLTAP
jgi:hypothetical protein